MDNTTSMQAQRKLGFLHHIRLVPLFSSILGGIILLFALSAGLAGISCCRLIPISRMSQQKFRCVWGFRTAPTICVPRESI